MTRIGRIGARQNRLRKRAGSLVHCWNPPANAGGSARSTRSAFKRTVMTTQHKIYILLGLAAVLVIGTVAGSLWSNHKTARLERESQTAIEKAANSEARADELERDAAGYKAKIDYLEHQLDDIQATAKQQDEQLQK